MLKFDPNNRRLVGRFTELYQKDRSKYDLYNNEAIYLEVIATDIVGEQVIDTITIEVVPSFLYILEVSSQIIGPILTALGIFKLKPELYGIFCKKKY